MIAAPLSRRLRMWCVYRQRARICCRRVEHACMGLAEMIEFDLNVRLGRLRQKAGEPGGRLGSNFVGIVGQVRLKTFAH